jgi:putative ABC transport system permease protein
VLKLALRSARAHWRRFILTVIAVVVGVAFVVGSFVLTDSLASSINRLLSSATGSVDLVVQTGGGGRRGGGGGIDPLGGRGGVPQALADQIATTPGVAAVDVSITGGGQLLDKAGNAGAFDLLPVTNWPTHPEMSALRLLSGRVPTGPDDAVLDSRSAQQRGLKVGSTLRLGTRRGIVNFRIVGLAQRGTGNLGAAGTLVAVTRDRAVDLVGQPNQVGSILIRLAPGADNDATATNIRAVVGAQATVTSSDALLADARQRIQDRLGTFNSVMLGFAAITLFVSAFLIWNTFTMAITQRRREFAVLRAIGARSRQVFGSVVIEAAVVGAVASAVGIGLGVLIAVGLRRLLDTFGVDLPSGGLIVAPRTIVVGILTGLGVTLVSVIRPARRVLKIPPVAALNDAQVPPTPPSVISARIGGAALVAGSSVAALGLLQTTRTTTNRLALLAVGGVIAVIGLVVISGWLAPTVMRVLGAPFQRTGSVAARLAVRNGSRDPRRTAATATALMIGIMLVALTLVVGASVKTAFGGALRESIRADAVVSSNGIVPFDSTMLDTIRAVPGTARVTPLPTTRLRLAPTSASTATVHDPTGSAPSTTAPSGSGSGGGTTPDQNGRGRRLGATVIESGALSSAVDPELSSGGWPTQSDQIAISGAFADEHQLKVGNTITLGDSGSPRTFTISGRYERDELLDDAVVLPTAVAGWTGVELSANTVLVSSADGGASPALLAGLRSATAAIPNSTATNVDDYVADQTSGLDIVLGIVNGLLLFAVVVATLGIANTLALSVVERTQEIGLLRAVGASRSAVRSMIRVEGVLVALFGGLSGLVVGVLFGAAVAAILPTATARLSFPYGRLGLLMLAAGLIGVLAAAIPARRAARLQVLEAITSP